LIQNDLKAEQIKEDYRKAVMSVRERALCDFAEKLTKTPSEMTPPDLEQLRKAGLDDSEIHDAVQVISYFNYINRIADALGCDLEPWMKKEV
jgi:uncharacterized peroxidase-related enzyme